MLEAKAKTHVKTIYLIHDQLIKQPNINTKINYSNDFNMLRNNTSNFLTLSVLEEVMLILVINFQYKLYPTVINNKPSKCVVHYDINTYKNFYYFTS